MNMKSKHILVVGVGTRPVHRYYLEKLKNLGHEITLLNSVYPHLLKDLFHYYIQSDLFQFEETIQTVRQHHEQRPIDGVFCYSEPFIVLAAAIREELGLPGISKERAYRCRNKYAMREAMKAAGVRIPRYRLARDRHSIYENAKELGFPCVIKPVEGASSTAVMLIQSDTELQYYLEELSFIPDKLNFQGEMPRSFLVEEYIDGEEVCIDSYVEKDRITPLMVCEKNPLRGPLFIEKWFLAPMRCQPEEWDRLIAFNEKCIKALGIDSGMVHAEFRIQNGQLFFLEAGARPGGLPMAEMIELSTGINPVELMVNAAVGNNERLKLPSHVQSVALQYIYADKTGVVTKLEGIDECMKAPGIHSVTVHTGIGKTVFAPPHPKGFRPSIASVIATGETSDQCLDHLMYATRLIQWEIANN